MADTLHLNDGTIEVLIGDNTLGRIIYEKLGREAELLFNQLVRDTDESTEEYETKINELKSEIQSLESVIFDLKNEIGILEDELDDLREQY